MTSSPLVHIGLVTWNSRPLLPSLFASLLPNQKKIPTQISILDNNSQDQTLTYLKKNHPKTKIYSSPVNLGFASAHNFLLSQNKAPFYFCLNPDIYLSPSYLPLLVKTLQKHPKVASAQGKLLKWNNPPHPPSNQNPQIDSLGLHFSSTLKVIDQNHNQADQPNLKIKTNLPGCTAAACLYRRSALLEINGFNETFFAYKEDIDLALRLTQKSWHHALNPHATAHHIRNLKPQSQKKPFERSLSFRNHSFLVQKHSTSFPHPFLIKLREILRSLYFYVYSPTLYHQVKYELKTSNLSQK